MLIQQKMLVSHICVEESESSYAEDRENYSDMDLGVCKRVYVAFL